MFQLDWSALHITQWYGYVAVSLFSINAGIFFNTEK